MAPIGFALQAAFIQGGFTSQTEWVERARAAERAGFETLCIADHPGYSASPFVSLAAAAQVTTRIRLATAAANLGVRDLVQVASDIATVDVLSNGRAVLGAGAGHAPSEWTWLGREFPPPRARVAQFIESVEALRRLLAGDTVTCDGEHVRLDGARLVHPLPLQSPLPLLVGGNNRELLRYAGTVADIVELSGIGRTVAPHAYAPEWGDRSFGERIEIINRAARGRTALPRVSVLVRHVEVTDDARAAATRVLGELTPEMRSDDLPVAGALSSSPFFLIGSADEIADELVRRRERWGITRYTVRWSSLEPMLPVLAVLDRMGELAS